MSRSDSPRPGSATATGGHSNSAASVAASDTEGWLARTLQLLASSRPDSVQQLRDLLDQAIGSEQAPSGVGAPPPQQQQQQNSARGSNNGQLTAGEPEKKKLKMTTSESRLRLIDMFSGDGGAASGASGSDAGVSGMTKSRSRPELASTGESSAAWHSDPAHCCVKCRSSRGQLVDCFDCKDFYHLDCHSPPVSESEVSDQRSVWYCLRCRRKGRPGAAGLAADLPTRPPANSVAPSAASSAASSSATASGGGHKIKAAAATGPAADLAPAKKRPKRD